MELQELTYLIKIREYVFNSINLPTIDRKTVKELNDMLLLLDKKIIGLITDVDFKDYIGYKDVQKAKIEAARITNIYSGIANKEELLNKSKNR